MNDVILSSEGLRAIIDPGRGADILDLTHVASGLNVLFSTPWRARADAIRAGVTAPAGVDSTSIWMEQYRGGWQVICPNPGAPRTIGGAPVGFHGETSTAPWQVLSHSAERVMLETELFFVPLRVTRSVTLDGATITIADDVHNLSGERLDIDYCSHPAFGGPLLDGTVRITTGATRFTPDPETYPESTESSPWPTAEFGPGDSVDLSVLGQETTNPLVFGWLSDFDQPWVQLANHTIGLAARISWDQATLPYAWVWAELNSTTSFPWFGRARTIAIEPSSTPTSGPKRAPGLALQPHQSLTLSTSIELIELGRDR